MTTNDLQTAGVGVIGLGIIGAPIAGHLERAGYRVARWNRTPKQGALASPADVAHAARVIHLFVADTAAVLEVLDAMGEALTPEHIILCNATIGLQGTLDAARKTASFGASFLDAPFTGTKGAADKAQLLYYIGGDTALLERVRPILEVSGGKGIVPIGKVGDAAVIKVATNVLSAAMVETLSEMAGVVKAAGMAPEVLAHALEFHGIRSGLSDLKLPKILSGDFSPHFYLKHMLKDARLGTDLARQFGMDLPVTEATTAAMETAVEKGWGDEDFAVLARRFL